MNRRSLRVFPTEVRKSYRIEAVLQVFALPLNQADKETLTENLKESNRTDALHT